MKRAQNRGNKDHILVFVTKIGRHAAEHQNTVNEKPEAKVSNELRIRLAESAERVYKVVRTICIIL